MKTNRMQDALLNELAEIHVDSVTKRAEIKRQIEAEFERQVEALRIRKAELMAKGVDELGLPKTRVGRAVGTSDWKTIEEMLELGRSLRPKSVTQRRLFSWGAVERYFAPTNYAAWVLEDGVEIESVAVDWVNPGYAVLALGAKGYRLNVGEDMLGEDEFRTQYPELFAWVQENPPAAPDAAEPVKPEPVTEEWEEEEYDD